MVSSTNSINPFNLAAFTTRDTSQASGSTADTFAAELSAALKQALQELGLNPAAVQVTTQAKGQDTATSATSGQFVVTVTDSAPQSNSSPSALEAAAASDNPYRTDVGGYNSLQYATDTTAQDLATALGATVVKTSSNTGPYSVPPQEMLDFGNGFVANAGLVEQFYQAFGPAAAKMLADQATLAQGNSTSGPNPTLAA